MAPAAGSSSPFMHFAGFSGRACTKHRGFFDLCPPVMNAKVVAMEHQLTWRDQPLHDCSRKVISVSPRNLGAIASSER
uniref:Uncharacterized protein n=1 Tax=Arundo donax TaxID=35708 RepID=A0A0A8YAY0_ARUDO